MKPLWQVPLFRRKSAGNENDSAAHGGLSLLRRNGAAPGQNKAALPRQALRWLGPESRIALRSFAFDADADAVCAFQEETYSLNFPGFQFDAAFSAAFRQDLRRAALDGQHGLFVLDEERLVGFLWLVICQNSWTSERYGYVNNLYVVPERRGLGLGRELMRHSDEFFRARGVKVARLSVTAANRAACTLYTDAGYVTERWEMEKKL